MADETTLLERVQELTWSLIDEQISTDELRLLDNLLLSDQAARKRYVECVQLNSDLYSHFARPAASVGESPGTKSPVLGFLNAGTALGYQMPSVEDPKS
jgi:hypothetical protein